MSKIAGRNSWLTLVVVAVVALVAGPSAVARAQCLPQANGVPAAPGAPKWWGGSLSDLNDPRWTGAFGVGYPGDAAEFKALSTKESGKDYALLSFHVRADPGPATDTDYVFFGFSDGASKAYAFQLKRTEGTTLSTGQTALAAEMVALQYGGGTTWSVITTPNWLSADANVVVVTCGGAPATCDWAFRVRVPFDPAAANITNGINLPATGFKFWYEMRAIAGGTATLYKWPETAADATTGGAPVRLTVAPDPTVWSPSSLSSAGGGGTCTGGVRIAPSHISVTYPGSASDTEISPKQANTFHARPLNESGGSLAHAALRARFRIANFGSTTNWIDIPSPSCASAFDATAGSVSSPTGAFDLTCSWTLSHDDACFYRPDVETGCPAGSTKHEHQCVLVELSTNNDGGTATVPFSVQSAFRNMHFGSASWFQRFATIDIKGAVAAPTPDVYAFVATRNLPAESPKPNDTGQGPKGYVNAEEAARIREQLTTGALTFDRVAELMPTYTVFVWVDSGRVLSHGGASLKVLVPRPSFGYFLSHEKRPVGWKHKFAADPGVTTLTTVLPDYYKLSTDKNSVLPVWTAVGAVDQGSAEPEPQPQWTSGGPTPPDLPAPIGWWVWLLFLLAILVLLFLLLRSRKHP